MKGFEEEATFIEIPWMNEKWECAQSKKPVKPYSIFFYFYPTYSPKQTLLFIYMELFFYILDICYFEMVLHVTGTKKNEEIKQWNG